MSHHLVTFFLLASTLVMINCEDYSFVDKAKADACAAGVVLTKADYDQLKRDAELGKSVGRYQVHRDGALVYCRTEFSEF